MQPNQPDPNQQNPTTSGTNIPEYLHMDPIVDPGVGEKKAKRRFVYVLMGLLFIVTITASLYWLLIVNSPQERFYRALENSLKKAYSTREYKVTSKNGLATETTIMKVNTDLSQPSAPKTDVVNYSYSKTSPDEPSQTIEGRTILVGNQQALALSKESTKTNTPLNVWNLKTLNNIDSLSYSLAQVDSMPVLNSPQGIFITGGFSSDQRTSLMSQIKSRAVYTILSTQSELENGRSQTVYTINVDSDKLDQLNKSAARIIGSSQLLTYQQQKWGDQETLKLSVDDKTDTFTKLQYAVGTEKRPNSFIKTIAFTYPDSISITMPKNGNNAQ